MRCLVYQTSDGRCFLAFEVGKASRKAFGGKKAAYAALNLADQISYISYWRVMSHKASPEADVLLVERVGLVHPAVDAVFSAPPDDAAV